MRLLIVILAIASLVIASNQDIYDHDKGNEQEEEEVKLKNERAAKVIDSVLGPDSLFGKVVSKQLELYFTSENPWGIASLFTLRMHLASMHGQNNDTTALEVDELKLQVFFAALLPEGLNDVVLIIMEAFNSQVLKKKGGLDLMLDVYLYVHFRSVQLPPFHLDERKPETRVYKLIERFRRMYPREKLEEYFFTKQTSN